MVLRSLNRTTRLVAAAGTLALALVLGGCGETPLTPLLSAPTQNIDTGTSYDTPPSAAGNLGPTSLTSSASIDGTVGGTLTCGRFALQFPAGAFPGTGTVTMRMNDSTVAVVDLGITPKRFNSFRQPVALTYDATGLGLTHPVTIYWWDPQRKRWIDLVAKVDPQTGLPTVRLKHFSQYAAGKAGW